MGLQANPDWIALNTECVGEGQQIAPAAELHGGHATVLLFDASGTRFRVQAESIHMPSDPVIGLVPSHKQDLEAAQRAVDAGWPAVEPVIADLVNWCLDGNWPVSRILGPFLGALGDKVVPAVRIVLDGDDATATYFILIGIVSDMPSEALAALSPSLVRIHEQPTSAELAEELPDIVQSLLRS